MQLLLLMQIGVAAGSWLLCLLIMNHAPQNRFLFVNIIVVFIIVLLKRNDYFFLRYYWFYFIFILGSSTVKHCRGRYSTNEGNWKWWLWPCLPCPISYLAKGNCFLKFYRLASKFGVILMKHEQKYLLIHQSLKPSWIIFLVCAEASLGVFWNNTGQTSGSWFIYSLCAVGIKLFNTVVFWN